MSDITKAFLERERVLLGRDSKSTTTRNPAPCTRANCALILNNGKGWGERYCFMAIAAWTSKVPIEYLCPKYAHQKEGQNE